MKKWSLLLIIIFCLAACHEKSVQNFSKTGNRYALGFKISSRNGIVRLTVHNPWEKAKNVKIDYFLVDRNLKLPGNLTGKNVIRTPVKRIVCLSTSHLAFLNELNELDKVTGISGSQYITNQGILKRIQEGTIRDVGYGQNLNYEEIINEKPDLVMVYGVDSEIAGFLGKFRDLGIPAVVNAEYLENSPLGKAEWIKFVAAFFGKELMADSLFSGTEERYTRLAKSVANVNPRPGVMIGLPFRDAWWIPGGKSYMAGLIEDAGGRYVAGDNPSHESFVISMEDALLLSGKADIWINTGTITRKSQILEVDSRFERFPLFQRGRIFNNNRRSTPAGGMDFWESGAVRPDVILSDLIRIFHPGILPGDSLTYYMEIK